MEAAYARRQFVGGPAASGVLDGLNRLAYAVYRVSNGVREVAIEKKEFQDAIGAQVCGIDLAISFKRGTAAEQADKFEVLVTGDLALGRMKEMSLVHIQQGSDCVCTLQVAAQPDEMPALSVDHCRVADAIEEVNGVDDGSKNVVDVRTELSFGGRCMHLVIEAIEALPLF